MSEAADIELLVLDFDGVLTDNRVYVDETGRESVRCSRADGMGIALAQYAGVDVVVLSSERNPVVRARCEKLGIACHTGLGDKISALKALARVCGVEPISIAYVGNDVNDVECMEWVGWPIAVADAHHEARSASVFTTRARGGHGAVREVCDWLLEQHGCPTQSV